MINILFSFTKDFLSEFIFKLINVTFLPYLYIYLIGVFVYVHRDKIIPTLKKGFWLIVALYVVWCIINMHIGFSLGHYANIISGSFVCVLTISAGYYFGNHRLQYDFSYSLYLYHMIIINVLAILGITGTWYSMVIVYLFTGVLSALSVFFVEGRGKKAIEKMILKN